MSISEILILSIALALDAMIVSFSYGLILINQRFRYALSLAASFGLFQFVMPILGWKFTGLIYSYSQKYSKWIVFTVFFCLGLKVLIEAMSSKKEESFISCISFFCILSLAIATSIDAFCAGVNIRFLECSIMIPSLMIGIITFVLSLVGFFVASILRQFPSKTMELLGALLLFYLAVKSII